MRKTSWSKRRSIASIPLFAFIGKYSALFVSLLFFFAVCLCFEDSIKVTAMVLMSLVLIIGVLRFPKLRDRVSFPLILLFLITLIDGISISYAVSTKLALYEFLPVLAAFCIALLLLMLARGTGSQPGRWVAVVLEGSAALSGLISVDLISTRLISTPVLSFLGRFTDGFSRLSVLVQGTRINSIYSNPNVFASIVGLGVLLSLGLVLSSQGRVERCFHTFCLFISALSFVLSVSLGASATIVVAFLAYLLLERRERRGALLFLMAETLMFTLCAAAAVSVTSFQEWDGVQPIPLLCMAAGGAALCLLDGLIGRRLAGRLRGGKTVLLIVCGVFALLAAYVVTALLWTEGITIQEGESLTRSAYPAPGEYTLEADLDGSVTVNIYSQNAQEVVMGTRNTLYWGKPSEDVPFTVPEDSLVVYFVFYADQPYYLDNVTYQGIGGSGSLPLKYKLLPEFIARRLQGVLASTTWTQRLTFFSDGMRLFRESPVIGLGMGSFENRLKSVQSFYFVTQYVHNHYIQTLTDTGIVGLVLFVSLIGISAAAVLLARRKETVHPLLPAAGAALVFMAGHAATEIIFSIYSYLPMAFGVFILIGLCCDQALPEISRRIKTGILAVIALLLCIFAVLLGENMRAAKAFQRNPTFSGLTAAIGYDRFERVDYMLAYVTNSLNPSLDVDDNIRRQADIYAEQLSRMDSNFIPFRLTEYYLRTDRVERGLEMAEKYVRYVASDEQAWQQTFDLLEKYETDSEVYRAGVLRIYQMLNEWNDENMGTVSVDEETMAFLARMEGQDPEISE